MKAPLLHIQTSNTLHWTSVPHYLKVSLHLRDLKYLSDDWYTDIDTHISLQWNYKFSYKQVLNSNHGQSYLFPKHKSEFLVQSQMHIT